MTRADAKLNSSGLEALIELAPDGIVVTDAQAGILSFNAAAAAMFGRTKEEVLGTAFAALIPKSMRAALSNAMAAARANSGAQIVELCGLQAGGGEFLFEMSLGSRMDGGDLQFTMMLRDLSQRKARQGMPLAIAEALPQIVWIADFSGNVEYSNRQWYEYTGITSPSALGWGTVIHPDDLPKVLREGEASNREKRAFEAHYRLRRHDGTYRWFLGRSVLLKDPATGVERRIGTATDVNEQREAQESLVALKQRTDSIIQDAPILLWAVDGKGDFTYYDGKVKNTLGIRTEDRLGANILKIYAGRGEIAGNVMRAFAGEIINDESEVNGVCLDNKFTPQFDAAGNINGVIGLSVDVTQRKMAEAARAEASGKAQAAIESSKLKSEFLATMSHEIRTPINGVLGMAGLLIDTPLTTEQHDFATAIRQSGESLLTLINDILDFSKIEAGRIDYEEAPFTIRDVINDLAKVMRLPADAKGVQLQLDLAADLPTQVSGDCGRFRQVLLNLLGNAVKFTQHGTIALQASLVSGSSDDCLVRLEVRDSGIGIPEKTLAGLFQPFTQADASTARRYGGSGLGLSICKGLVLGMGGQIGATSREGLGSTFWFTCPLRIPARAVDVVATVAAPAAKRTYSERLLVAEDNPINQIIAVKMLEKHGFQADVVGNGVEALAALAKTAYDLVLMDCQMPEMDGYEATRRIRQSTSLAKPSIPIIAMTANAMKGDAEKCFDAGMTDYVSKPVKADKLVEVILKHLKPRKVDGAA